MTHPGHDAPRLWFKMVPNNQITADGTWTQRLLEHHHTVRRAAEPDHGDHAICNCGFKGRFDSAPGPDAVFPDSIWVSGPGGAPECVDCHLK